MRQAVKATPSPIFKFRTFILVPKIDWRPTNPVHVLLVPAFDRRQKRGCAEQNVKTAILENFAKKYYFTLKTCDVTNWRHVSSDKSSECSDLFRKYLILNRALSSCKGEHLTQIYVVVFWFTRKEFNLGKTYLFFHLRKELPSKMWWSIIENYDQRNIL